MAVDLQPQSHALDRWVDAWMRDKFTSHPSRKIQSDQSEFYGVVTVGDEVGFPYFREGDVQPCAFKVRSGNKQFRVVGDLREAGLFGQQKYGNHDRKRIVVTEGEFDALAARTLFSGKSDVVSLKTGAQGAGKDFKTAYNFLDGYQEIIVCFDADEAGNGAVERVADIFAGKVRIMRLDPKTGKDANDYLTAGKGKEFTDLYWSASQYTPQGVLSKEELWERLSRERPDAMGDYPWQPLNELTYGFRPTELITVTAGSGLGKSSILREIVMHIKNTTTNKVGVLFMEESVERTAEGFMGVDLSTPVHLPTSKVKRGDEEYKASFDRVFGDDNLFVMDASFDTGATVDQVVSRVRYMAKAMDCKIIVLDHISILVSGGQHGDERRALDEIMTKLRTLTQDTGIVLFAVSHLKRPDGKGHEEGAVTSVAQLRGSAAIAQLSDFVIGLERNGQAECPVERNTTQMRVLKNRFSGITGPAGWVLYNGETGRLEEFTPLEKDDAL
jgi:twinkle protein